MQTALSLEHTEPSHERRGLMNVRMAHPTILSCCLLFLASGCAEMDTGSGVYSAGKPSSGDGSEGIEAGQLTASEWRDLDHWGFWTELLNTEGHQHNSWGYDTTGWIPVVVSQNDRPVADALVRLYNAEEAVVWEARTDNSGEAELFTSMFGEQEKGPYTITVEAVGSPEREVMSGVERGSMAQASIELAQEAPNVLDLMFVIDTTSSMHDELAYIQSELADVIDRVRNNASEDLQLRISINVYCDANDTFYVHSNPFTTDVSKALRDLKQVPTCGGGDWQEAVEAGLADGIENHDWSASARARLLFLVLDAPPHDNQNTMASLETSTRAAARKGIRIMPVTASGIDKGTEFLMRFMAIATGGSYIFLTDHSGIGNDHLEASTGPVEVELFNLLLVRVIGAAIESRDSIESFTPERLVAP